MSEMKNVKFDWEDFERTGIYCPYIPFPISGSLDSEGLPKKGVLTRYTEKLREQS